MLRTSQKIIFGAAITGLLAPVSWPVLAAPPADWSQIPTKTVTLFYPGQGGYQWLRSRDHRRADKKVKKAIPVSLATRARKPRWASSSSAAKGWSPLP